MTIGAIVSKTEYSHFINCLLVVIVVAFLPLLKIMAVLIFKNFKKALEVQTFSWILLTAVSTSGGLSQKT